jgi:hypothetical protein
MSVPLFLPTSLNPNLVLSKSVMTPLTPLGLNQSGKFSMQTENNTVGTVAVPDNVCSRRKFLTTSAMAVVASTMPFPRCLFAEEPSREDTADDVWAFASDMHIADWTDKPPEYNVRFQSVIAAILKEPVKPRRLFLLGDNVGGGSQGQYKRLLEILQPLVDAGIGIHASLGDHDHRERFRTIRPQLLPTEKKDESITHIVQTESWADGETKHLEIIETKRANFFMLDSLDKTDQEEGEFGKHQLDWLAAELDRRKEKPAILMAHHPAIRAVNAGLADMLPFWKLVGTRPQVKAYFFGHSHVWFNYRFGRVHQVNFPATSRCPPLTALGWVSMNLLDDGVHLTLKTCDPNHPQNGERVSLKWV